jgi:hypothetical protein
MKRTQFSGRYPSPVTRSFSVLSIVCQGCSIFCRLTKPMATADIVQSGRARAGARLIWLMIGAQHRTRVTALGSVCAVLAMPAWALAQAQTSLSVPPASVPPNLQALEQKMEQIRFDTARITSRAVLGDIGPVISGAELGTGVTGSNTLVISTTASVSLAPSESTSTSRIENSDRPGSALGFSEFQERTIGQAACDTD